MSDVESWELIFKRPWSQTHRSYFFYLSKLANNYKYYWAYVHLYVGFVKGGMACDSLVLCLSNIKKNCQKIILLFDAFEVYRT